jgi:anti-anti-sigma factor
VKTTQLRDRAGIRADVDRNGRNVVLRLHGALDRESVPVLERLLGNLCRDDPRELLVDLADVSSLHRVALGALAIATSRLRDGGCPVVFINPSPPARRLIELEGVAELLSIVKVRSDAEAV